VEVLTTISGSVVDQGVDIHELITILGQHGHPENIMRCLHVTFTCMACDLHDSLCVMLEFCHACVTDVLHVTCMIGSHDLHVILASGSCGLHVILAFWVMWFACDTDLS